MRAVGWVARVLGKLGRRLIVGLLVITLVWLLLWGITQL
jgi:hypothetical protein